MGYSWWTHLNNFGSLWYSGGLGFIVYMCLHLQESSEKPYSWWKSRTTGFPVFEDTSEWVGKEPWYGLMLSRSQRTNTVSRDKQGKTHILQRCLKQKCIKQLQASRGLLLLKSIILTFLPLNTHISTLHAKRCSGYRGRVDCTFPPIMKYCGLSAE